MNILICGASGFLGQALTNALRAAGHRVVRGVRRPSAPEDMPIDYAVDTDASAWRPRLAGIDAVINAVGVIAESKHMRFEEIHSRAPIALFHACAQVGVKRVVQISALGAETGDTPYFRSKRAADHALQQLPLDWQIVRPSLVYGEHGDSATMFRMLASLPLIAYPTLPSAARFRPIHADDLVAAILHAFDPAAPVRQVINCVGATEHSFRDMLAGYRDAFQLKPPLWLPIPTFVMRLTAAVAGLIPGSILNADSWRMLCQGNTADSANITAWLGRSPKGLNDFIAPTDGERLRANAMSMWSRPLLRLSLAAVWLISAYVSAFAYPQAASLQLLSEVGITGSAALVALYGASTLDLLLGVATLIYPHRATWCAQGALMLGYSLIVAVTLPIWLIHPFAPIVKNLPMLAILVLLTAEDRATTEDRASGS